jgi:hypothetical protein
VYRAKPTRTGHLALPRLAFEVVSESSLGHAGLKAAKLRARGIGRVFALHLRRKRVLEWSQAREAWVPLTAARIKDRALSVPLPVAALLESAKSDDSVARALLAKRNPVLEEARARDRADADRAGHARGLSEAVAAVLASRGIELARAEAARIRRERDPQTLDRWLDRAATCASVAELFARVNEPAAQPARRRTRAAASPRRRAARPGKARTTRRA